MNLRPLHDRVIVTSLPKETQTSSGFLLSDTSDKASTERGLIIAIGPGRLFENGTRATMSVSVGDTVLFKSYTSDTVTLEGKVFSVIGENDIVAIIEA